MTQIQTLRGSIPTGWVVPAAVPCPALPERAILSDGRHTISGHGRAGQCQLSAMVHPIMLSTRPFSFPIDTIVLHQLMREAKHAGARFLAHFVRTDRNRQMFI